MSDDPATNQSPVSPDEVEALAQRLGALGYPLDVPFDWLAKTPGEPRDLPAELGLSDSDVPALVEVLKLYDAQIRRDIAQQGSVQEFTPDDERRFRAPYRAAVALAQLGAGAALPEVIAATRTANEVLDDQWLHRLPRILGWFGQPMWEPIREIAQRRDEDTFVRWNMLDGLVALARQDDSMRPKVTHWLGQWLEQMVRDAGGFEVNEPQKGDTTPAGDPDEDPLIPTYVLSSMVDLDVDLLHADLIERGYAINLFDESLFGDWAALKADRGYGGIGLIPDQPSRWRHGGEGGGASSRSGNKRASDPPGKRGLGGKAQKRKRRGRGRDNGK